MNKKQDLTAVDSTKSGAKVAQNKRNLPRTHKDYWRNKVAKRKVKGALATHFSVRLNYNKSREYFNLGTANKLDAADLAKGIYDFLKVNGWDATREKFKPTAEAKLEIETVGDLIAVFTETSTVRERTKSGYKNHLRRLAGDIKRIPDDPSKYRPGGSDWQVKIDRIKLKDITTEKVAAWRRKQLLGLTPAEAERKETSVSTIINYSRSIWKYSTLPSPFDGFKWKLDVRPHKETVSASDLLGLAERDLKKSEPEQYRALILCLFLGLRKKEADCLTWAQIDTVKSEVSIRSTDYFRPKSRKSTRDIPMQESLVERVLSWKKDADKVFVLHGGIAKPNSKHAYYRANKTWKGLGAWLKSKGVTNSMPIHYLRKLAGSLMYTAYGAVAAQQLLGHESIETTAGSYLSADRRTFDIQPTSPELTIAEG